MTLGALRETYYDLAGRPVRSVGPLSNAEGQRPETVVAYSPAGTIAPQSETSSNPEPRVTRYAYNAHGEAVASEGPRSIDGVVASTTRGHDPFGQVTTMRRRLAADRWLSTTSGYDAAGNTTSVAQPPGDGAQLSATFAFDALDRLAAQTTRTDKVNGAGVAEPSPPRAPTTRWPRRWPPTTTPPPPMTIDRTRWRELLVGLERVEVLDVVRRFERLVVTVESTDRMMGCSACGTRATIKDRTELTWPIFPPSVPGHPGVAQASLALWRRRLPARHLDRGSPRHRPDPIDDDPPGRSVGHHPGRSPRALGVLGSQGRAIYSPESGRGWRSENGNGRGEYLPEVASENRKSLARRA